MLNPLYIAVSWVLLQWHRLFDAMGLPPDGGITWALAIVFLVITIRILLFRFFIKQVHSQRKMQEVQPKIAALRDKYKNDRQTLSQEMMKLQREEGFNPLGGCLPILLQAPIFLALFHVLRQIGTDKAHFLADEYHWQTHQVTSAGNAKLFGVAPIAAAFNTPADVLQRLGGSSGGSKLIAFVLIVLMCAATFITQKQIMRSSGRVLEGQQAMIQKFLLYGMPASLFVSGFFFPIGVLLYWFTNNLWTMAQQFYILHRMPHPDAAKTTDRPATDPKALAPRPGQKPVNPKARRPAGTTGTAGTANSGGSASAGAGAAEGGSAGTTPRPGQKPANPKRGAAAAGPAGGSGRAAGADGAKADAKADGAKPDGARPDDEAAAADATVADGASGDADAGASSGGTAAAGGPPNTPRPARRPPSRRASTTTRPKKKRR